MPYCVSVVALEQSGYTVGGVWVYHACVVICW